MILFTPSFLISSCTFHDCKADLFAKIILFEKLKNYSHSQNFVLCVIVVILNIQYILKTETQSNAATIT